MKVGKTGNGGKCKMSMQSVRVGGKNQKKRGLDVRQARSIVQDRSEWRGFVRGYAWGVARGMNP